MTIHVVEWHLKVIFCFLATPNFDFGEFEKPIFQVVARHWELIFFLLTTPKAIWVNSRMRWVLSAW